MGVGNSCSSTRSSTSSKETLPTTASTTSTSSTTATTTTIPTTTTSVPSLGQSQTTDLGTVTVFAVHYPVQGTGEANSIKDPGKQFAVADLQVCPTVAAPEGSPGFQPDDFVVQTSDNRTWSFWNVQIGARDPNIVRPMLNLHGPTMTCVRGWLTFQIDPGEAVTG